MEDNKKQVDEKIADALGIEHDEDSPSTAEMHHGSETPPEEHAQNELEKLVDQSLNKSKDERYMEVDFLHSRTSIKRLISRGEEMFEDAYRVAQETDQARSFEVAGGILKNIIDANHNLIKMHEDRAKIRKAVSGEDPKLVQNNTNSNNTTNVFTGTSSDLLRQLLESEEAEDTIKKVDNRASK